MALFIGIVGLPNVGKSTLFNALTQAGAEASAYPFCTIEPNIGVVNVPDERLARLAEVLHPESVTPTQIRFVDIAGLVRGASQGEGLGNRFLGHIREADALVHVVRCFDDDNVSHVDGSVDAIRDAETLDAELMLADLESATSAQERLVKILRSDPRAPEKATHELLNRIAAGLERGIPVREQGLNERERAAVRDFSFLSGKRVLYLANVRDDSLPDGGEEGSRLATRFGIESVLAVSAQIEAEIG